MIRYMLLPFYTIAADDLSERMLTALKHRGERGVKEHEIKKKKKKKKDVSEYNSIHEVRDVWVISGQRVPECGCV